MTRLRSTSLRSVTLSAGMVLFVLGTSSTAALADDHEADDARIKYRQSVMSTIGSIWPSDWFWVFSLLYPF